jgi:hypothetical protein
MYGRRRFARRPFVVARDAMAAMHTYGESVAAAGIVLVDGAALMNSLHGKELIAGYSVCEVKDMDEALAWPKRWPFPALGRSEIEIRPLFEWQAADETFAERVV